MKTIIIHNTNIFDTRNVYVCVYVRNTVTFQYVFLQAFGYLFTYHRTRVSSDTLSTTGSYRGAI